MTDEFLKWFLIGFVIFGGLLFVITVILEKMKPRIKYRHWLPRSLLVSGITIWPWVMFDLEKKFIGEIPFKHECIHLQQVRRMGWLRFYGGYLVLYVLLSFRYLFGILGKVYENHPYEKEAFKRQEETLTSGENILKKEDKWITESP